MMNKNTLLIIITLFLGLIITGCRHNSAVITEIENDIKFDSIMVKEKYHLLGDTTNPYCSLESVFTFPSDYKDKEILDKLKTYFVHSFFGEDISTENPKEAIDIYTQMYITDYKELESDFIEELKITGEKPQHDSWYSYYEISSNEILYNKCNLLSYGVSVEYFTGGAHGGNGFNNYVINLITGDEINEDDIFIKNYEDSLAQIILYTIASDNNVESPEELESMGFFNIDEIYPNSNFYVDAKGITYTYNEYEIAAQYVGRIDVFIPYERIRQLIRNDSPVAPLVFKKK